MSTSSPLTAKKPRRIEPIFDASGALRRHVVRNLSTAQQQQAAAQSVEAEIKKG